MPEQAIRIRNGQVVPSRNPRAGAACRRSPASTRENTTRPAAEQRLIRAYLTLFVTPADPDGARTASLARFGAFEVRLCEPPEDADLFPLRVELYCHDRRAILDSCGCDELDTAVTTAEGFMSRAARLNEAAGRFKVLRN